MEGTSVVTVSHNFETAHRLPFLGGKCVNLHGHSWKVEVSLLNTVHDGGINQAGIAVEYGLAKKIIRKWIDDHLDHGVMLGSSDELVVDGVHKHFGKVFLFGASGSPAHLTGTYFELPWPTVEAVGRMLAAKLQDVLHEACGPYIYIDMIRVQETDTNASLYMPDVPMLQRVDVEQQKRTANLTVQLSEGEVKVAPPK